MREKIAIEGGVPVRQTLLPLHRPSITQADERSVIEALRSGWLTTGPRTHAFERDLAAYVGARHCVGVNSCTAALHLALKALGVREGDEVITTPMTFAATANVICHCGARPVFVDVEPDTFNLDPECLEAAVTDRTRAIIAVDLAGHPAELDAIQAVAEPRGLAVVEDAAHSLGAEYKGRKVGGLADFTAFSFYATKNITSGEGGALTTNDEAHAERARIMSLHGISRDAWERYTGGGARQYDIVAPGFKYNMFDLQAALLETQLQRIETLWERRREITARLRVLLGDVQELVLPAERPHVTHAYHLFRVIIRTEALTVDRDLLMEALQKENIGVGVHYRAVHLHPYYREAFGLRRGMFPRAEYCSDRTLSLPFFPGMSAEDLDDVAAAVRRVIGRYRA